MNGRYKIRKTYPTLTSPIAVDTETTGLLPFCGCRPFAVSLCDVTGAAIYMEWPVDPFTRTVSPNPFDIRYLNDIIGNPYIVKVFHNAKFDVRMLEMVGVKVRGIIHDTLIAARVCNTVEPAFGLKVLANKYLDIDKTDEELLKKKVMAARRLGKKLGYKLHKDLEADYWMIAAIARLTANTTFNDGEVEHYATLDVIRTMGLWLMYEEVMDKDSDHAATYSREMELWHVVYEMETRGIHFNTELNESQIEDCKRRMIEHHKNMIEASGIADFRPGSVKMISRYLYGPPPEGLGLEMPDVQMIGSQSGKKTAVGTNWRALSEYNEIPFVRNLLMWRGRLKAKGFFQEYKEYVAPDPLVPGGYCIHASFNQTGARTGRFSSSSPNMQQAPSAKLAFRSFDPINSREPFVPRPGYIFLMFDYSGQEVRIFADVSGDEKMMNTFRSGNVDIHEANAHAAWGGKDNPAAIKAATFVLELGTMKASNENIARVWDELGWSYDKAGLGVNSQEAKDAALRWLEKWDYNIPRGEVIDLDKKSIRGRAKMLVFSKIYGGGPDTVRQLLYCSREEAKEYLNQFDRAFPRVRQFMDELIAECKERHYVETLYGRKLMLEPGFEYRCVNYLVQGTAADMMKDSMQRISEYLKRTGLDAHLIMTVHDEIVLEVRQEHAHKWLMRGIIQIMEDNGGRISLPMVVDVNMATHDWEHKNQVPSCPDAPYLFAHSTHPIKGSKMHFCEVCNKEFSPKS